MHWKISRSSILSQELSHPLVSLSCHWLASLIRWVYLCVIYFANGDIFPFYSHPVFVYQLEKSHIFADLDATGQNHLMQVQKPFQ